MIKLSIIIPVYKTEKYIDTCLKSIFIQDVGIDSYEVIIVNDGSPDKSMNIIRKYENLYSNIKVILQENQGLSVARNSGLAVAQGKYVWFVDSDDTIVPNSIRYLFKIMEQFPLTDIFASLLIRVNEKTGIEQIDKFNSLPIDIILGKEYLFNNFYFGASQRFIIRNSFLNENGLLFLKGVYHEDGEFGVRMLYLASSMHILNKPVYKYLVRSSGSIMSSWRLKNSEDLIKIYFSLVSFSVRYVTKEDARKFNYIIYEILLCSIYFAGEQWNTLIFKLFYKKNKALIKEKARQFINPINYGFSVSLKSFICYISPLGLFKLKKKLKELKKNDQNTYSASI